MSTKKVPCTAAAAGAPWTSFVAAVDEVARTPPGRIFPDIWCSESGNGRPVSGNVPGYGFPDQMPSLHLWIRAVGARRRPWRRIVQCLPHFLR